METTVVGTITFGNHVLNVYSSLDEPLFRASEVAEMVQYGEGNTWALLNLCEEDEKLNLLTVVAGQRRKVSFVTELGLYNILAQSRKPLARMWRRIIHTELIELRKGRGMDISQQFEEWDHRLDDIWYDEETGTLMQSVTVAGGDVEEVPYEG